MSVTFNPDHLLGVEYMDLLTRMDHNGNQVLRMDPKTYTCKSLYDIRFLTGLYQIIHSLNLKGIYGVIQTGGHENDLRIRR